MPCFPLALLLAANFATLQTLLLSPSPCSCFCVIHLVAGRPASSPAARIAGRLFT